jgi:hypothetical protein
MECHFGIRIARCGWKEPRIFVRFRPVALTGWQPKKGFSGG